LSEELQILFTWLSSREVSFLDKYGIDGTYFFSMGGVYDWIVQFIRNTGKLPLAVTVAREFDEFHVLEEVEPLKHLIDVLLERKAYTNYRPLLTSSAELVNKGKTLDAMYKMRTDLDKLLKSYTPGIDRYDWVKNAEERYLKYMEKHGQTGLSGIPTGHVDLDMLTGGWRDDDLILLSGRLSEGKSLVGGFFGFHAWKYIRESKVNAPVIYLTTEMPELEIAYRLDTLKAHFSNRALNEGKLEDVELYKDYLEDLQSRDSSFLILSQESNGGRNFTVKDIRTIVESEKPAFLIIDQLYDISDGGSEKDIRKRIVNVSTEVRELNLATKTPTLLLAQSGRASALSAKRDGEATPDLHEIQESDNPAQKATRAITLRLINGERFKLSLKKNRGGKRDQDVYFKVDIDTGMWYEESVETSCF